MLHLMTTKSTMLVSVCVCDLNKFTVMVSLTVQQ